MRAHPHPPTRAPAEPERPRLPETVQRWQEGGGPEGIALEWMLDRICAPREAST